LNIGGPCDEPVFCYLLGCAFQQNGLPWQAAQEFERTLTLGPSEPALELALAEVYTQLRVIDRARPLINRIRNQTRNLPADSALDLKLALLEANTWLLQTNVANARTALQSVVRQYPNDAQIANRVISAYLVFGDFTNALRLVEAKLSKAPDDVPTLNNQAAILIQSGHAAAAIPVLNHVLTLTNLPGALLNRAVARLICEDNAAAETDFHALEKSGAEPGRVNYVLAMFAEHRHDTNQAMHYLRVCLTNTPSGTILWHQATVRLQAIKHGQPFNVTDKPIQAPDEK
jgi:tetratricopeptide (TPR) repeat protein